MSEGSSATGPGPASRPVTATATRAVRAGVPGAPARAGSALPLLGLGALGVVYGDIGTSPLYALRQCFVGARAVPVTPENVFGILSVVFWVLVMVISVKYLAFMMRAANQGEGGILALLALALGRDGGGDAARRRGRSVLAGLGIFGAALLYGDGAITPAISVLSAIEGLEVATSDFRPLVVPLTIAILAALFLVQKRGTGRVAAVFGPAMLVWFVVIGALGARSIALQDAAQTSVLHALDPRWALSFLWGQGTAAFFVLGSVVLVVTGGEALYADMGHFGARPIRFAWYAVVLPALVLNYFGQGVLLLESGSAGAHPFFDLAPAWALYPLVGLATVATIIASQALISGAFSLTQQAIVLGYSPRFPIVHTSDRARGQIFLPHVSTGLMVVCILLVLGFRSSSALADAYGIAVTGTMTITSLLFYRVARTRWRWPLPLALGLTATFLVFDLSFLSANLDKLDSGGWVPVTIALLVFVVMTTWKRGRGELASALAAQGEPAESFLHRLAEKPPQRVPGTVIYVTANRSTIPLILERNLELNQVLHERVVLLSTGSADRPRVPDEERVTVLDMGQGFYRVLALFGFMEQPRVDAIAACSATHGLVFDVERTDFLIGTDSVRATGHAPMARWRKRLFALLVRLNPPPTTSLGIPPERVILLGREIEL